MNHIHKRSKFPYLWQQLQHVMSYHHELLKYHEQYSYLQYLQVKFQDEPIRYLEHHFLMLDLAWDPSIASYFTGTLAYPKL